MATEEVKVPDIGDFDEVPVIEVLVSEGDDVEAEQPLVTLESDKATMDVPSPSAGKVASLKVDVGDKVSEGSPLLDLEVGDEGSGGEGGDEDDQGADAGEEDESPKGEGEESEESEADSEAPAEPESSEDSAAQGPSDAESRESVVKRENSNSRRGGGKVYAGPGVRRLARELGVELSSVKGSGRKGRILKEDVQAAKDKPAQAPEAPAGIPGLELAPWPKVDFEKYGEVERVTLSRIKRISGPALSRNWVMIPHVTHEDEADITELEAFRKEINAEEKGVKVTMVALLMKACAAALRQFPEFNSSLDGDELVIKRYFNIGFAADTPQGLLVPVIKEADRKGLLEIARELTELSEKAREGKISAEEMRGSTFTISSLGGIGGTGFTPIINAPEVAILGVTRSRTKPIWDAEAEEFKPRLMVPLSLSYDHRVIDGAAAARFTAHLADELSDIRRALL
ncbi:MAG: dihydrolipoyllysine-residue acetyltransferase [Actinomycetota bacterium]|nr:dihydrolipoyllysine-residue acetyltransferase [Actinomycetota bacterium]